DRKRAVTKYIPDDPYDGVKRSALRIDMQRITKIDVGIPNWQDTVLEAFPDQKTHGIKPIHDVELHGILKATDRPVSHKEKQYCQERFFVFCKPHAIDRYLISHRKNNIIHRSLFHETYCPEFGTTKLLAQWINRILATIAS